MTPKTEPKTVSLSPGQAIVLRLAGEALAASEAETDPDRYGLHTGPLEHHIQALMDLVGELTGG